LKVTDLARKKLEGKDVRLTGSNESSVADLVECPSEKRALVIADWEEREREGKASDRTSEGGRNGVRTVAWFTSVGSAQTALWSTLEEGGREGGRWGATRWWTLGGKRRGRGPFFLRLLNFSKGFEWRRAWCPVSDSDRDANGLSGCGSDGATGEKDEEKERKERNGNETLLLADRLLIPSLMRFRLWPL
jgi:hypothetical protein